jgi:hypothetical protein
MHTRLPAAAAGAGAAAQECWTAWGGGKGGVAKEGNIWRELASGGDTSGEAKAVVRHIVNGDSIIL